jgi:hypothetical protein
MSVALCFIVKIPIAGTTCFVDAAVAGTTLWML